MIYLENMLGTVYFVVCNWENSLNLYGINCVFYLGNAIYHAKTPVMDGLCQGDGYTTLDASGLSVGLPAGLMGNSEVGHLNIGAGRVVYQDIVRINMTSDNKEFHKNEYFEKACNTAKNGNGRLHFLGLVCVLKPSCSSLQSLLIFNDCSQSLE